MKQRIVLAYSGGLDTSVGIGWIQDATGAEVIAVAVDVGQGGEDLDVIRQRALDCGAAEAYVADARDEFASEYCMPALAANALYMDKYPLVSSLSRPVIVKHLVTAAKEFGATTVAHGCTGKGNDQVRFEVGIVSLAPELTCIAPVRDLALTREKAIDYAEQHQLPIATTKKNPFSIDQNVWGRAIETGYLEDIWNGPTKDVYNYTDDPAFPPVPDEVIIRFERGVPVAIDGEAVTPLQAIQEMNRRAGAHGVGRIDMVEDRLVGIKSREIYEAPGRDGAHRGAPRARGRHRGARARAVQADGGPALERARLRRHVVQPAQDVARRLPREHPGARERRDPDGPPRRPRHGGGAALRREPLRLRPRHLR